MYGLPLIFFTHEVAQINQPRPYKQRIQTMVWSLLFPEPEIKRTAHSVKTENGADQLLDQALEVDYETDCTALYQKIQEGEYAAVTKFLETGYWPGSIFADEVNPAIQARVWVTRFEGFDGKKVRWSQLPIHLAIVVGAPDGLIKALLELYPEAIRCTDDQRMLPLHLALQHGLSDDLVDHLLTLFPESVRAKGKKERSAIEIAKRGKNKIRGRILENFVYYSKVKHTHNLNQDLQLSRAPSLRDGPA
jgi:hypothetical protein